MIERQRDGQRQALRDYAGLLLAGGLPALVGIPGFGWLVYAGVPSLAANLLVLSVSAMVTFVLNLRVVFAYRELSWHRSLVRFLVVVTVTSAVDVAVIVLLSPLFPATPLAQSAVKAAGIVAGVVARLVLMRAWAFAGPARSRSGTASDLGDS